MKRKQAKRKQGYHEISCCCESCAHVFVKISDDAEDSHRCGIGGFKVKMNGTCHEWKESMFLGKK